MLSIDRAKDYLHYFSEIATDAELADLLDEFTREMGFAYFALTHHVDIRHRPDRAIRLLNYPGDWVEYYDRHGLGTSDPVHRASHVTNLAFAWSKIPELIALSARDRDILAMGGNNGIGDGFTVPAHIPGESHGSCTFANPIGVPLPEDQLPMAWLIGQYAFATARRLWQVRPVEATPLLTERQKECVTWVAAGKTDWEIGQILGIAEDTVADHLKHARDRYGGGNRSALVARTLYDTSISFPEIFLR